MKDFENCKCCLQEGELRHMWIQYVDDGVAEIYGEMLNDCFAMSWQKSEEYSEQICESCIKRLRDALSFKKDVIFAKEVLDEVTAIKEESENVKDENSDYEQIEQEWLEEKKVADSEEQPPDEDEMQVEYLEDDDEARQVLGLIPSRPKKRKRGKHLKLKPKKKYTVEVLNTAMDMVLTSQMTRIEASVQYNIPIRTLRAKLREKEDNLTGQVLSKILSLPKRGKRRTHLKPNQNMVEVLNTAVDMVLTNKMTRIEASVHYNIPLKTLRAKLSEKEDNPNTKQDKFSEELRMILSYTNAIPFKTKISTFYCAYCYIGGPAFQEPAPLKKHTRTFHENDRLDVETFYQPTDYVNEVVKLDIEDLHCTECESPIENWNAMFRHLQETHDVVLDQAYTKAIPYVLKEDIKCALCNESFPHFHQLDSHMNAHYDNYICGDCGATYLSRNRWKAHVDTHSTQRFPCPECEKVFTLKKYRKRHYERVHLLQALFPCKYCSEPFHNEYSRHLHMLSNHKEKTKSIECEYCGMTFTYRQYYSKHIKLKHKERERKFKCKLCTKTFHMKHELKNHEDWHEGRKYTCPVCDRKFASKPYLQKHRKTHTNESSDEVIVNDLEGMNEIKEMTAEKEVNVAKSSVTETNVPKGGNLTKGGTVTKRVTVTKGVTVKGRTVKRRAKDDE